MPFTPTYTGDEPINNADFDTWGVKNNLLINQAKVDFDAIAAVLNPTEAAAAAAQATANAALPRAGGAMTGSLVLFDIGPGSVFTAGYRGMPRTNVDANRNFALDDAGKMVRGFGSNPRTWTILENTPIGMPIGTVIGIRNYHSVPLTIARAAGVTLTSVGSFVDGNRTVAPGGFAALIYEDTNIWFLTGTGVS